jgi:hypothetical protein
MGPNDYVPLLLFSSTEIDTPYQRSLSGDPEIPCFVSHIWVILEPGCANNHLED